VARADLVAHPEAHPQDTPKFGGFDDFSQTFHQNYQKSTLPFKYDQTSKILGAFCIRCIFPSDQGVRGGCTTRGY